MLRERERVAGVKLIGARLCIPNKAPNNYNTKVKLLIEHGQADHFVRASVFCLVCSFDCISASEELCVRPWFTDWRQLLSLSTVQSGSPRAYHRVC